MGTEPKILRGYGALRVGRWSANDANYFVTGCLERPLTGLANEPLAGIVGAKIRDLETAGCWKLRTFVLMPDHFHLLFTLRNTTDLSGVIRLFKGPLTPALRKNGLCWQKSFYDHRLRTVDELLPTFLYIFLNPYRAKLLSVDERWPWYYCAADDWEWFAPLTQESLPFPEWLK